jgi:hypothetical protein
MASDVSVMEIYSIAEGVSVNCTVRAEGTENDVDREVFIFSCNDFPPITVTIVDSSNLATAVDAVTNFGDSPNDDLKHLGYLSSPLIRATALFAVCVQLSDAVDRGLQSRDRIPRAIATRDIAHSSHWQCECWQVRDHATHRATRLSRTSCSLLAVSRLSRLVRYILHNRIATGHLLASGKTCESVETRLGDCMSVCELRQPSVLFLDNLDQLCAMQNDENRQIVSDRLAVGMGRLLCTVGSG